MTVSAATGGRSRNLVLAAMIFAVAMTFIDQFIVSIAVPEIQKELGTHEHRRAVGRERLPPRAGGPVCFRRSPRRTPSVTERWSRSAWSSCSPPPPPACGLTPKGSLAECPDRDLPRRAGRGRSASCSPRRSPSWCRPSALRERGKALALFFGIAGGLTAIGPVLGGYLDGVDLAGDFLGQHTGRRHRAHSDRYPQAGRPSTSRRAWTTGASS